MIVLFTHEIHASKIGDDFYNKGGVINSLALSNYLHAASRGILITRTINETKKQEGISYLPLNSDTINVVPIAEFSLKSIFSNFRMVLKQIDNASCYLIRLPGLTGVFVGLILLFKRKPFGVELAGDLEESLNELYGKPTYIKRKLIDLFSNLNKLLIRKAVAVSYRSKLLKDKYPNGNQANEFVFSGAQIFREDVGMSKSNEHYNNGVIKLFYLGRISPEKGIEYLVRAISLLKLKQIDISLTIVGDGVQFDFIKKLIDEEGLSDTVSMKGKLTEKSEIHQIMDESHIFVIPSLTEGMPRALIEAMARGMVAIGSKVGGIPELLEDYYLFEPRNPHLIANKIEELIKRRNSMAEISEENIRLSESHWVDNINSTKTSFWDKVKAR